MSDHTSGHREPLSRTAFAALAFALGAVVFYVLAGGFDDGLYLVAGALGIVAFGLGLKARREARRAGSHARLALTAIVVGGLLGGLVVAFSIGWGVYHLVT